MTNLTVSNPGAQAEAQLEAANNVLCAIEQVRLAYEQLQQVATTDKLKKHCLDEQSRTYTGKQLFVYALESQGITMLEEKV
jgi:hypothetical protein